MVELPPLLRLPAEIRQMILVPLLAADELLLSPSRVYGNPLISWKTIHGVQTDMMFTCRLLYHEVLRTFLQENDFYFSVPPTTSRFSCAHYARWAKSIRFQVNQSHWDEWQIYLSENDPLPVKNLIIDIVQHSSRLYNNMILRLEIVNLCESLVDHIVITDRVSVRMSSNRTKFVRGECM